MKTATISNDFMTSAYKQKKKNYKNPLNIYIPMIQLKKATRNFLIYSSYQFKRTRIVH